MYDLLFQAVIPFILSAFIVILIMFIAERYGTKIGGIFGTLPSTIVIAFLFISINKGVDFASQSVAVVPAELGVNLIFLLLFSILVYRSIYLAFAGSLTIWVILSSLLLILNITNIFISLAIFLVSLGFTFTFLELFKKIPSTASVVVHYTPMKIALRGLIAGTVIAIAVLLSNVGAVLSGIFSVFPAILSSTMLISVKEHGPDFAVGLAKSMVFGVPSVLSYATSIHFLYPKYGIIWGSIFAYGVSIVVTLVLLNLRFKIR